MSAEIMTTDSRGRSFWVINRHTQIDALANGREIEIVGTKLGFKFSTIDGKIPRLFNQEFLPGASLALAGNRVAFARETV